MKYGELTLGQVEAVVNKLGGIEGVKRFLSGEMVVKVERNFKIWRTIKRGTEFNTPDDFRHALQDNGKKVSKWANDMMSQPAFADSLLGDPEQEYDLVLLTTQQLTGKKQNATTVEVFAGAAGLGLEKCLAWIGPKLRLEYSDQPNGEWIRVGMEPILVSDGYLRVSAVRRHDSDLWLDSDPWDSLGPVWDSDNRWGFVLPPK